MLKAARKVNPLKVLNSTVNMVDCAYIAKWLSEEIRKHRTESEKFTRQLIVTGFHGLYYAHRHPEYFVGGEQCDLWVPDSIAPVLIARWRGMKHVQRTPGMELMEQFFDIAEREGYSNYFYGDRQETLNRLEIELHKRWPKLKIAGTFSPPYRRLTDEEEAEHVRMINAAQPDVLWVGLGLPKQDLWIFRNKHLLTVPVASGVGAAFGFFAQTTLRAPMFLRRCGLEWLYMLVSRPQRTWRRVLLDGSGFICAVMREEISRCFTKPSTKKKGSKK